MKKTVKNLWLGAGYNIIAVPLAAGGLATAGNKIKTPEVEFKYNFRGILYQLSLYIFICLKGAK